VSLAQRLARLEIVEQERVVYELAERIAERHGVPVDQVLHRAQEIGGRIEHWGFDAELRRLARDHGLTEEEARARYEVAREEFGL
jgi:HD-like signal output (HDOD) protein